MPDSPASSDSVTSVVSVPNQWTGEMELRAVPDPLECPPTKDPFNDHALFRRVAAEKIEDWRRCTYEKQTVKPFVADKAKSWKPAPLYKIDFDKPTYDSGEATVTYPVYRKDLSPLSFYYQFVSSVSFHA